MKNELVPLRYMAACPAMFTAGGMAATAIILYSVSNNYRYLSIYEVFGWAAAMIIPCMVLGLALTPFFLNTARGEWTSYHRPPVTTYPQDMTVLVKKSETEVERITGKSVGEWVEFARALQKKNYRFRARSVPKYYDDFYPLIEHLSTPGKSGSLNLTREGKQVIKTIALLPSTSSDMPIGVSGRLTHT